MPRLTRRFLTLMLIPSVVVVGATKDWVATIFTLGTTGRPPFSYSSAGSHLLWQR